MMLSWGIESVTRDQLDRWQPTDRGSAIWDPSFDPSTPEAHQFFLNTCDDLRTKDCTAKGCMDGSGKLVRRTSSGEPILTCFFDDWRAWYSVNRTAECCAEDTSWQTNVLGPERTCANLVRERGCAAELHI
eukprot:SAG31_NODE_13331_length_876_cov_1.092664_1_plen_130_part_10